MEAAAEHGAALKSVLAPTGHADSLALVERGGSWSPQQRLKRARADPSASGSGSQETHSPGASHATTASAARVEPLPAGVALGDTAGDNGKGALFTLSAVCHDALHADEANAAGWKGCAVKEGTAPAEQDSASSQALAFSMWGTGDTGAPGTRSTRPSGDTSPQPQQQAQRRSGPISTATATEEERLRCQAELATTRLLGSNSPAIIPQTVFLEAIQGGQDAIDLFEFRWPRERQASRTSTILSLTNRQHGIMYALAGCSDVMYVMSRVKAEVRETLQRLYAIDKINFYTWFKNRRLPLKRLLDRQAARAANAAKAEGLGQQTPQVTPRGLDGSSGAGSGSGARTGNRASDGTSSQPSSGNANANAAAPGGSSAAPHAAGSSAGVAAATSLLGKRSLSDSMDATHLRLPLLGRGGSCGNPEGPASVRSVEPLLLGHSPAACRPQVAGILLDAPPQGPGGQGVGRLAFGGLSDQAAALSAAVASGEFEPVTLLLPKGAITGGAGGGGAGALHVLQGAAGGGDGGAAAGGQGADRGRSVQDNGLQLVQLMGGEEQVVAPQQLLAVSSEQLARLRASGGGALDLGVHGGKGGHSSGAKPQLLQMLGCGGGSSGSGGQTSGLSGGMISLERLLAAGGGGAGGGLVLSASQLAALTQPQPQQQQQQLCIRGADGQLHLLSLGRESAPVSFLQYQELPSLQSLQQHDPRPRLLTQAGGGGGGGQQSILQRLVAQQQFANHQAMQQQQQQQQQPRFVLQAAANGSHSDAGMQSPLVLLQQPLYASQNIYTALPPGLSVLSLSGRGGPGAGGSARKDA